MVPGVWLPHLNADFLRSRSRCFGRGFPSTVLRLGRPTYLCYLPASFLIFRSAQERPARLLAAVAFRARFIWVLTGKAEILLKQNRESVHMDIGSHRCREDTNRTDG